MYALCSSSRAVREVDAGNVHSGGDHLGNASRLAGPIVQTCLVRASIHRAGLYQRGLQGIVERPKSDRQPRC